MRVSIFIFLFLLLSLKLFPQQNNITVSGKVFDTENNSLSFPVLMIVNLSTQRGIFGNSDGTFTTSLQKKDTLLISATGYSMKKICFTDSADLSSFNIAIPLSKLHRDLKEVEIFPERDLDKIEKDIDKLGYNESDYRLTGIDAWRAPLTAIYEEFSRHEKDKRRAAQLRNESRKRDLLKELLRLYEKNKLVNLPGEEVDAFLDYLNINEEMMKRWTQYELAIYIKSRYEHFKN